MIIFKIKTWTCFECGYSQDFEPTQENTNKHFNSDKEFRIFNLVGNECPACALKGIRGKLLGKETDASKKMTMLAYDKESDRDAMRQELLAGPKQKIFLGKEIRLETSKEQDKRIEKAILGRGLSDSQENALKNRLKALPKLQIEARIFEDETDEEKVVRIEAEVNAIQLATTEKIKFLRDTYEDK